MTTYPTAGERLAMDEAARDYRSFIADLLDYAHSAEDEFEFGIEEPSDRDALAQVLDYLESAEGAIADARQQVEYILQHSVFEDEAMTLDVRMRDLEGHGNLAGR